MPPKKNNRKPIIPASVPIPKAIKQYLQTAYLDYVNNYLTQAKFAENYGLTKKDARLILSVGRSIHESIVKEYKKTIKK